MLNAQTAISEREIWTRDLYVHWKQSVVIGKEKELVGIVAFCLPLWKKEMIGLFPWT